MNAYNLKDVTDCNCNYKLKLTLQCCSIVTNKKTLLQRKLTHINISYLYCMNCTNPVTCH